VPEAGLVMPVTCTTSTSPAFRLWLFAFAAVGAETTSDVPLQVTP
jgi:hypothetical protein